MSLIVINIVAGINYYIDPLRMYTHNHENNSKQLDFNERQQKTNYLKYVNNDFNAVLLGSSRTTFINQYVFNEMRVFNYAANAMTIYEYKKFINYSKKLMSGRLENIILGLDFVGTNKLKNKQYSDDDYLEKTGSFLYRFKTLYSSRLLGYSIRNMRLKSDPIKPFYSRNNIKSEPPSYKVNNIKKINRTLIDYSYELDGHIEEYFKSLIRENRDSTFSVFTTPVSRPQLDLYYRNGLIIYYYEWLRMLVNVFGSVDHFMYPNPVVNNMDNFFDAHHMKSHVGKRIAEYVSGKRVSDHFGITLTKENIEEFIENYEKDYYRNE